MKPGPFTPSSPQQRVAIVVGLVVVALLGAMLWARMSEGRCRATHYARMALDCTGPPAPRRGTGRY